MEKKKYGPNERTDQNLKIEPRDAEIASLSDAQFKTLVIRMLTEIIKYGCKIEEEVKAMQSEIKKNIEGRNSKGKKTGTQIKDLEQKEEINIQPEQNEEIRIQKNEKRLRSLQDILKRANLRIIAVPEGEEEEQEIEDYLNK